MLHSVLPEKHSIVQSTLQLGRVGGNSLSKEGNKKGFWIKALRKPKELRPVKSNVECIAYKNPPELLQICCSLARIPQTTLRTENHLFHTVSWPVQRLRRSYSLTVPPPYNTHMKTDGSIDLKDFLAKLPPPMKVIYEKAGPEKLINLMLPASIICNEARRIAATFWVWLCVTDDILEERDDVQFCKGIHDMRDSLTGKLQTCDYKDESQLSFVTCLFREMIYGTKIYGFSPGQKLWRLEFINCLQEIILAFELERPLMKAGRGVELEAWMKLRVVTISARIFMVLAKASLNIPGGMSPLGNPFSPNYQRFPGKPSDGETGLVCLETTLQCILGLQNDILGWEKDHCEKLNLNCVQILLGKQRLPTDTDCAFALDTAIDVHNKLVVSAISRASGLLTLSGSATTSANPPQDVVVIPSPTNSISPSSVASMNISPSTSIDNLLSSKQERTVAAADRSENDSEDDSSPYSCKEFTLRLFGHTVRVTWSLPLTRSSGAGNREEKEKIRVYVNVLLNMANGMANWMVNSRRYAVQGEN